MSSPLSDDFIANLLKQEKKRESQPKKGRGGGRTKADPTEPRTINVWFKQSHHICHPDCEHRVDKPGIPDRACWNPDCVDDNEKRRQPRGDWVVVLIKGEWICRYCFLAGYLSDTINQIP